MMARISWGVALVALFAPASVDSKEAPDPVNRIFLVGDRLDAIDTGIRVRPQDLVTIRAGSQVCFSGGDEESCVRADGWPRATYAESWPGDAAACDDPFPELNHATVVAMIGEESIPVGKQNTVSGKEGRLLVGVNDCSFEGEFRNEGQFSVVIVLENPTALAARTGRELIDSALDALGGGAIRGVSSLGVRAACTGPGGPFTTEVLSIFPDQTLFRQSSEEGSIELLAIGDEAWRIDRERGRRDPAKKMLTMIRGHEFHAILFNLDTRFTDHTVPMPREGEDEAGGESDSEAGGVNDCVRVEMRDVYGAPAAVCLDPESHLPVRLSFQPGGKKKEPTIEMELESWTEIDGVRYLEAFTLRQADDVVTYAYEEIRPNSVERAVFREVSPSALREIRRRLKQGADEEGSEQPEASASDSEGPENPEDPEANEAEGDG